MIKIVGGKYKGSNLNVPLGNKVRPTSIGKRKIIFDILTSFFLKQDNIENYNNKIILDGFSGSGAMGIEAISRGASFCYFFDKDKSIIINLKKNCKKILLNNQYKIINSNFENLDYNKIKNKIDIVFIDPPYEYNINEKKIEILKKIIADDVIIVIEISSKSKTPIISFLEIFNEKIIGKTKIIFYKKLFK
ncbi:MAG: Ribosomal RNA small subunit methyltransferase D [Alphaproteobacteria bacterium MarineAlpha5_Bin12]|nr:16S rRNA (guanine(966)-N(2))-methyltransferase RsmD [Pelagibacteraceae bacterium]PPR40844.1 MAG: Ribosomal RNA small subunit methyltransferase D [Alphaproteobacteria bacterium MarineAlpha5_Bin12]|tara:strand:+ start:343 stop:915 length:573 start_codon:yes stop_codon:yes gene_type:complete